MIQKIYFIQNNDSLLSALSNLGKYTNTFQVKKSNLEKKLLKNSEIIILDDSHKMFDNYIIDHDLKNYKHCILLLKTANKSNTLDGTKILYKPLRIIDLYKEIIFKINLKKKNIKKWKLDKSRLLIINPDGNEIKLTEIELQLLSILVKINNRPVSKNILLKKVWNLNYGFSNSIETRVLETTISRIRKKLSDFNDGPKIQKKKDGYQILFNFF